MSDSLWPYGLQHARLPCPSSTPRDCSNSCPSSRWYHPTISSSVIPFSSCLQSFPASGSFPMSQFFASGGQSIRASALDKIIEERGTAGAQWTEMSPSVMWLCDHSLVSFKMHIWPTDSSVNVFRGSLVSLEKWQMVRRKVWVSEDWKLAWTVCLRRILENQSWQELVYGVLPLQQSRGMNRKPRNSTNAFSGKLLNTTRSSK